MYTYVKTNSMNWNKQKNRLLQGESTEAKKYKLVCWCLCVCVCVGTSHVLGRNIDERCQRDSKRSLKKENKANLHIETGL